jgi:hypothetical protein
MSWDVFIQHLPASAATVDDVPDDFEPQPLGGRADVNRAIAEAFPGADFSDPLWIRATEHSYLVEIGTGDGEQVTCVSVHVRGDEAAIPRIQQLIELLGARAVDSWTGDFFDASTAGESLRRWRMLVEQD